MKIEAEADKGINRLPSVEVENDSYHSNYEQIKTYQRYFGNSANIMDDYKKYLDKRYQNEIVHPMTRTAYQQYINTLHNEYIDDYVQPLWENMLNNNLDRVNEIKQSMQAFLQK